MADKGIDFLKQRYDLHKTPEVKAAARRTQARIGEPIPESSSSQVQNYLDRFTEIVGRTDPNKQMRGIEALKRTLSNKVVIKPDDVPESTFLLEQRIAREQGRGSIEITDEYKREKTNQIITNQTRSLNNWIDYLAYDGALYPDWAKYWTLRSVTEMGKFEKVSQDDGKETARFSKRTKETTASFPTINPRALAMSIGVMRSKLVEKQNPKTERQPIKNVSIKLNDADFQNLLSSESFAKFYTQFIIEIPEYSTEGLQETRGKWVTYPQYSEPTQLVESLKGHPLEWCTADLDTARTHLQGGDFYVYYSINEKGEAVIPRLAIRMDGAQIAEDPRGIAPNQNLDPYIGDVLEKRLKEFGAEGEVYKKKSSDMKRVTAVDNKIKAKEPLEKEDLIFLYEIDASIEGFGYQRDPRVDELRANRNPKEDAPIIFDCRPDQIAWKQEEIDEDTKAYVGPLFSGIFHQVHGLDHIYTTFPEGKIRFQNVTVGGKSPQELQEELIGGNFKISDYAKSLMASKDFHTFSDPETISTVRLKVRDLGLTGRPTTDQLYTRAQELGLELCPAEIGPHLRIAYKDQPMDEWLHIGMKQIADSDGSPNVFYLERDGREMLVGGALMEPGDTLDPRHEFVFSIRK